MRNALKSISYQTQSLALWLVKGCSTVSQSRSWPEAERLLSIRLTNKADTALRGNRKVRVKEIRAHVVDERAQFGREMPAGRPQRPK